MTVPAVPGVLEAEDVRRTAAALAAAQEPDGAIPLAPGEHTDVWNHLEAAMALLVGGEESASARALDWALATQRDDGSWPMRVRRGVVLDEGGDTNQAGYLAVATWHHWRVRRDPATLRRLWPAVRRALDWVCAHQLPWGGFAWSQGRGNGAPGLLGGDALLAGTASIHHALRAGTVLAGLVGDPRPPWVPAARRAAHAVRCHPDRFLDKATFSMDWYYPVLGGAVRGEAARARIASRWDDFVVPGLGVRCVDTNPWVTGAETCELVLVLDALGDGRRARRLFADVQHARHADGGYWTGYVYPDDAFWPVEQSTYTAAAVILAADALSGATPGSDLVRGAGLGRALPALPRGCDCAPDAPSADRVARVPP